MDGKEVNNSDGAICGVYLSLDDFDGGIGIVQWIKSVMTLISDNKKKLKNIYRWNLWY